MWANGHSKHAICLSFYCNPPSRLGKGVEEFESGSVTVEKCVCVCVCMCEDIAITMTYNYKWRLVMYLEGQFY